MVKKANPENLGKKINNSHVVFQVTKLIYEGVGDAQIGRVLQERYSFKVSTPSIAAFRNNYYQCRLAEMKQFSDEFQQKQVGRIQTFIDESLAQAAEIKKDIARYQTQIADLEKELQWVRKFEFLFESAIDQYVREFDADDPSLFPKSDGSPEERLLRTVTDAMGADGRSLLVAYVAARNSLGLVRHVSSLRTSTLSQRAALVKIHRDIFKGYRNFSIMQELVGIFERYNALIVEEFFPDRNSMDRTKYFRVRKRILALFDEFQIRYQGVDGPSDQAHSPKEEVLDTVIKKVAAERLDEASTTPIEAPDIPVPRANPEAADSVQMVPHPALNNEEQVKLDGMFSTVIDCGADILSDLDCKSDQVQARSAAEHAAQATHIPETA